MNKDHPRKSAGKSRAFSLLEAVIAIALMALCILIFAFILTDSLKAYRNMKAETSVKQKADGVIEQLTSEIRSAYALDTASCNNSRVVFFRSFEDRNSGQAYVYKISYEQVKDTVERAWWRTDNPSGANGRDVIATNIESLDLGYVVDLAKPGFTSSLKCEIKSRDKVQNRDITYRSATQSKRRVVKQADSVSVTDEK
ncbi:MAG: type II secretion system protein [Candidatus Eremiobacteraeota bacterium]|nr:type II secretion system protein [Candidatus Eremiobacteraeota bacterium]